MGDVAPLSIALMDLAQRDASPNKLRIKQLSEKLGFLQDEMDHEKQARSDATEVKLLRAQITEEEKLRPLNEQIERLMEELSAERLSREVMDERKSKEIKSVESSISLDLTAEKRARKDLDAK